MSDDEHLERIGAQALTRYRLELERIDPEPHPAPRSPVLDRRPTVQTSRKFRNWRLKLQGVRV